MIEKIFAWAWRVGLDVELYSRTYEFPVRSPIDTGFRLREPLTLQTPGRLTGDIPCLRFRRGERQFVLTATSYAELLLRLEHEHQHMFAELSCPPLRLTEAPHPDRDEDKN